MKKLTLTFLVALGFICQANAGIREDLAFDESLYQKVANAVVNSPLVGYTTHIVSKIFNKDGSYEVYLQPVDKNDEPYIVNINQNGHSISYDAANSPAKKWFDEQRSIERMETIKKYAKVALSTVGVAAVLGGLYWAWNR